MTRVWDSTLKEGFYYSLVQSIVGIWGQALSIALSEGLHEPLLSLLRSLHAVNYSCYPATCR